MIRGGRVLATLLVGAGALTLAEGLYLPAKAWLAQELLDAAWWRALQGNEHARPWPWAQTWPVARLVAPAHGQELIVLAGAEGSSLAFGPGHVDGTALPGTPGNAVVAGHRDTHFKWLGRLAPGEELLIERPDGELRRYLVRTTSIVDEHEASVLAPAAGTVLTLVTCYPFDAVMPGGPLRYVVRAEMVEQGGRSGGRKQAQSGSASFARSS